MVASIADALFLPAPGVSVEAGQKEASLDAFSTSQTRPLPGAQQILLRRRPGSAPVWRLKRTAMQCVARESVCDVKLI